MIAVSDAVVLVTGGRRGLGSALVDEVLARGARKVYATARDPYTDSRDRVVAQQLEVSSDESVTALAAVATDVDIVINNAGILRDKSFTKMEPADFELVTEILRRREGAA